MPDTTRRTNRDDVRADLEKLAATDWEAAPLIQAFLTAIDYDDHCLIESQQNAICECLRDLMSEQVQKRLGSLAALKGIWQKLHDVGPSPSFDEVGKQFLTLFETRIAALVKLQEKPVFGILDELGYPVPGYGKLGDEVLDLKNLKHAIFENWPWSSRPLPPVDREMVARSRAALVQREGESFEDMVKRVRAPRTTAP